MAVIGIATIIPIAVSFVYAEDPQPFELMSALLIVIGLLFWKVVKTEEAMRLKHAMILAALTYLILSIFGTLPFLYYGMPFVDAFFESMSGWSTTGLTLIQDVEAMPKSVLFWRSFMQWIGGLGVILLLLVILTHPGIVAAKLYEAEARRKKIKPSLISTIRIIWWIYFFYTGLGMLLYYLAGMSLFDAINHAMVVLGTGGFSVKNGSIGSYNSLTIEGISILIMFLGATNFYVHYRFLTGRRKAMLKDVQVRVMLAILLVSTIFLILKHHPFRESIFQAFTALTCCGVSTADVSEWSDFSKSIIILLMVIGGGAGSTSGAIKIIRTIVVVKSIYWWVLQIFLPEKAVITYKVGDTEITDEEVRETTVFVLLYLIFILIGGFVFMYLGYSSTNSIFEVVSAQGNVGLSCGITSLTMPLLGKIMLIFNMWVGRLEIIPVLILLRAIFLIKPSEKVET